MVVALPYGLEGFAMNKNLKKADGSNAKTDETLEFEILEFNKNQRKINVSHLHTWNQEAANEQAAVTASSAPKRGGRPKKSDNEGGDQQAVKAVNAQVEKSTLGDIGALAGLKEKMEGNEADKKGE